MPRLLDLFCGGGGAARGYQRAGFDHIVGVDIEPQPRYVGDEFVQADALEYLAAHGQKFDAIHASPPCQGYSIMHNLPWLRGRDYPLLLLPVVEMLEALDRPYVVENVMGARHGARNLRKRGLEAHGLQAGWLCGTMFGLPFYRHRLFAANWLWLAPGHSKHQRSASPTGANPVNSAWRQHDDGRNPKGTLNTWGPESGMGRQVGWKMAAAAMDINWMRRQELTQAIPPAFTEHIGRQLLALAGAPS